MKVCMRWYLLTVVLSIGVAVLAGLTGTVAIKVVDENGSVIPGVTITVNGDNLSQEHIVVTEPNGTARIPELPPGIYTLEAKMMGMNTITQQVKVVVNKTTSLELIMTLSAHEIVVDDSADVHDLNSTTTKENIERDVTERLPGSDDLFQAFSMTGGVTGGGNVRVHGATKTDNVHLFDGIVNNNKTSDSPGYLEPPKNTEEYDAVSGKDYSMVMLEPLSTFSIDVDTASYTNMRRFLSDDYMPPPESVRIEEFINYFNYDYPNPENDDDAFSVNYEVSECPWDRSHRLVHIGIQGRKIELDEAPPGNFVFLLDVSGSMGSRDKLPLLKQGFKLLVNELDEKDTISIVTYAGSSGLVLPPTSGAHKDKIIDALNRLHSGGSTAGAAGIRQAYQVAQDNFIEGGNNRVILATDGDFNVGISSDDEMIKLIEEKRKSGVFLSTLGFGKGNIKDSKMEKLADHGNGNYSYIDSIMEAEKVLVRELGGTLIAIAKDVKLQVEFNPAKVASYRLIGYENRILATEDFDNDAKDAGELGAGHSVTALYEVIPTRDIPELFEQEHLRYQKLNLSKHALKSNELFNLKLRYKKPDADTSRLIEMPLKDRIVTLKKTSDNYRFSAAVALFGMLVRQSAFSGSGTYDMVLELARSSKGDDPYGYRAEFIQLVEKAKLIKKVNIESCKLQVES